MEEGKDRNEMEDRSLEDGEVEDLILHPPNEHPSADTRVCVFSSIYMRSSKMDSRKQF